MIKCVNLEVLSFSHTSVVKEFFEEIREDDEEATQKTLRKLKGPFPLAGFLACAAVICGAITFRSADYSIAGNKTASGNEPLNNFT
jgi:hypothetical protein